MIIERAHDADSFESALAAARNKTILAEKKNEELQAVLERQRLEQARITSERDALIAAQPNLPMRIADAEKATAYDTIAKAIPGPASAAQRPAQLADTFVGQYRQAMGELSRLKGNGSGLPFCWVTASGDPVYMMRLELRDDGFVAHELENRPRPDDPAWALLSQMPREQAIREEALATYAAPLLNAARLRRCRYAVEVFDRTATTNKAMYRHLNYVLDLSFARKEINR